MSDLSKLFAELREARRCIGELRAVARAQTKVIDEETARVEAAEDRCARLEKALRIIAGEQQCADNLMSDKDIARAALPLSSEQEGGDG